MKTVDLTPLKSNDSEYEKLAASISERYKCDWDDAIHDSYLRYVKQIQEHSKEVRVIRCKAESLDKEAEGLRVEDLKKKASILCREADSI